MGCDAGGVSRAGADDVLSALVMTDQAEIDRFFEREMPSNETAPLFDEAKRLAIGFYLGYAELAVEDGRMRRFNTSILVEQDGRIVGKYRKVHLPGHAEHEPERPFQHLEKRYFEVGNLGFPVFKAFGGNMGMCICNDRRWPETYRVMGLQDVEMVMLGYNTPLHNPPSPDHDEHSWFHNQLSMQAGAYQNGTWVVGVAKGGTEEGVPSLADCMIVAPSGEVVARADGIDDELIVHRCDLDAGQSYKRTTFNFAVHRQPDLPPHRRAEGRSRSVMKGAQRRPSHPLRRRHPRQARRGRRARATILSFADPAWLGPPPAFNAWLAGRAALIAERTGLPRQKVRAELGEAYWRLARAPADYRHIVLWLEHDLYDQAALVRVLASFALRKTLPQDRADLHRPLPRHQTLHRAGPAHAGRSSPRCGPNASASAAGSSRSATRAWAALRALTPRAARGPA